MCLRVMMKLAQGGGREMIKIMFDAIAFFYVFFYFGFGSTSEKVQKKHPTDDRTQNSLRSFQVKLKTVLFSHDICCFFILFISFCVFFTV